MYHESFSAWISAQKPLESSLILIIKAHKNHDEIHQQFTSQNENI